MLPLGTTAPAFKLPDSVSGSEISLSDADRAEVTVVMFICNHCPYVIHVQDEIVNIANDFIPKGVRFVAISSNDIEHYPADAPELMKERAENLGFKFPYLYDESQEVAKAYMAACTPDFYVFDKELKCVYRGRMDGSTPGNGVPVTGEDLRAAIQAVLDGAVILADQYPSMGCNIKWKQS